MTRLVAWLWAGIVIGVSFVATPAKFSAGSLERPVALDVGRATFRALNRLEWALAATLLVLLAVQARRGERATRRILGAHAAVLVAVLAQSLWLLPLLNDRVATIIAGNEPRDDGWQLHAFYGLSEVAKVVALGLIGHWWRPAQPISAHVVGEPPVPQRAHR